MSEASVRSRMSPHRSPPDPAHGVFETMLVRDGLPVELDAHLARLGASVAGLYHETSLPDVVPIVIDRAHGLRLGRLRLTVAPNGSGHLATDVRVAPVEAARVFPAFSHAVRLHRLDVPGGLGPHKWADRRLLESAEAEAVGSVPLLVDEDGTVLEASRANVFLVEDGELITPPADGRILPGVTRRRVLELRPVREEAFPFDRLLAADEVFLSGSVRGIEPVWDCDGVRTWHAGTITPLVSGELRRRWEMDR
jgi:para-aminobenzoate synthetase / 4-amino-4-deoxychorismate lyase